MPFIVKRALVALVLGAAVGLSQIGAAGAQDRFSDAKLTAFVTAAAHVEVLIERWDPRIKAATTEKEQAELVDAARAEMREVVEATPDMSVDEYNQIVVAARNDPELAARIDKMFAERSGQ